MSIAFVVQTEKSTNLQTDGFYTLAFFDKNFKINKIELFKLLKEAGIYAVSVNSINTYQKIKNRTQKRVKVKQFRPKKFIVKTKDSQVIDEKAIEAINAKLIEKYEPKNIIKETK